MLKKKFGSGTVTDLAFDLKLDLHELTHPFHDGKPEPIAFNLGMQ